MSQYLQIVLPGAFPFCGLFLRGGNFPSSINRNFSANGPYIHCYTRQSFTENIFINGAQFVKIFFCKKSPLYDILFVIFCDILVDVGLAFSKQQMSYSFKLLGESFRNSIKQAAFKFVR